MRKTQQLILASASPRRKELIQLLRLPTVVISSDVDEHTEPGLHPGDIVEMLSLRKAKAVRELTAESGIIVGSDTIVTLDDQVLGKPIDQQDALRMLMLLQGRDHEVYSGVTCLDTETGLTVTAHQVTKVRMKSMSEAALSRYVETGEPMDKAGAYAIQGIGSVLVEGIEGDFFNVVGLPVSLLGEMLKKFDIEVL